MEPKLVVLPGGLSARPPRDGAALTGPAPAPPVLAEAGPTPLGAAQVLPGRPAEGAPTGPRLEPGAAVEFDTDKGLTLRGRIARLQKDGTVTVMTEQGGWRVAVERLRSAPAVRKTARPSLRIIPRE